MGSDAKATKVLLVDLDGTLYRSQQLFEDVRVNINGEESTHLRSPARAEPSRLRWAAPPFRVASLCEGGRSD